MKWNKIKQIIKIFLKAPGKLKMIRKSLIVLMKEGIPGLKRGIKSKIDSYNRMSTIYVNENKAQQFFNDQQNQFAIDSIKQSIERFIKKPLISIIMPTYNSPLKWLRLAIESVVRQIYENWELCIVDNGSMETGVYDILNEYAKKYPKRIKVKFLSKNMGISFASNIALDMANGSYIALLDHDDELTPDALFWVANEINRFPDVDFIYSDECKIDDTEERRLFHFFFKPDWSPEFLMNCMYTGHLTVYRTSIVKEVGAFRSEYDFSQDYDLALRISEKAKSIRHIERILYLWRSVPGSAAQGGKPWARLSNLNALHDAMRRRNVSSYIIPLPYANRIRRLSSITEKVSIIIPSDSMANLTESINILLIKTSYPNYEIVIVTNSILIEKLKTQWKPFQNISYVNYDKPFNFSDKCNEGAKFASGEIIVFLNDDVYPRDDCWLWNLIEYLYIDNVGAVSPKLVYENGIIQYAGMFVGAPGFIGTSYSGYQENELDEYNTLHRLVRNVTIFSGACFAIKSKLFTELGGFDSDNTPNGHSDVDLSFRIKEKGLRIVYTPYTTLVHKGNHSWHDVDKCKKPDIYLMKRWADYLTSDPFFTNSMKKFIYRDFPYEWHFYGKKIDTKLKRNILLISHEMSLTGAPMVLLYLARIIRQNGDYPVIISPIDGEMRQVLFNEGFHVIIDQNLYCNDILFKKFANNFDFIIANTLLSLPVVIQLCEMRIFWWIHEGYYALSNYIKVNKEFFSDIQKLRDNTNLQVLYVSEYSKNIFEKKLGLKRNKVLPFGLPDERYIGIEGEHSNIQFIMIGSIEPRKGQDILINAITHLPEATREKASFHIIGNVLNQKYYDNITTYSFNIKELYIEGALPHDEVIKRIAVSDIVIAPSRDDPFPVTLCEAMMCAKPCISSNMVGISYYIKSKNCGWVFDINKPEELTEIMNNIISGNAKLREMGENARKAYEENFTMEKFSTHVEELFLLAEKDDIKSSSIKKE